MDFNSLQILGILQKEGFNTFAESRSEEKKKIKNSVEKKKEIEFIIDML